jgi:Flp pilus assembly protein TadG
LDIVETSGVFLGALWRDKRGAVMVEVAILLTIMFMVVLGGVDLLFLFYQWNAAAKAVQIGARLAAVSDSVATGLNQLSNHALDSSVPPGAAMPNFIVTCDGRTATCTCNNDSVCRGTTRYNQAAMNTIVFGRSSSSCSDAQSGEKLGMCDIFSRITPANVKIVYAQTGLGYAGRPAGPMPTITVSLQNLRFNFFFLGGFTGFRDRQIPASPVSLTAGDLSSTEPSF